MFRSNLLVFVLSLLPPPPPHQQQQQQQPYQRYLNYLPLIDFDVSRFVFRIASVHFFLHLI
jgi:hypothetical protein